MLLGKYGHLFCESYEIHCIGWMQNCLLPELMLYIVISVLCVELLPSRGANLIQQNSVRNALRFL